MGVRVLMLDLGETLVHEDTAYPHVSDALTAISQLQTMEGDPLATCLVSDFDMPTPPATPKKIEKIFNKYLTLLDNFGLRELFEPVERRVTLSTHAGAFKPDRRVFDKAIERLGMDACLEDCLFITENEEHLTAAGKLGIDTLQFGSQAAGFTYWAEAPLIIAVKLSGQEPSNLAVSLGEWLQAVHGMQLVDLEPSESEEIIRAKVNDTCLLPPGEVETENLHVELPISIELRLDDIGRVQSMKKKSPSGDSISEATQFVKTLRAHKQIADTPGPLPPGATHQIVTDPQGRKLLKRRRYSAV